MSKIRNIILVLLVAATLLSTGVYAALAGAGVIERPMRSSLEGRGYQAGVTVTPEAIASGEFQDGVEHFLADAVPGRDQVMLTNAFVQRRTIQLANLPFGYEVYPAFFGAEYLLMPRYGAAIEMPQVRSAELEAQYARGAQLSTKVARAYPGTNWYFCLVDRGGSSSALPVQGMMANAVDYEGYREMLLDQLGPEFTIVDGNAYTDPVAYYNDYFLTDHHWNIVGALKCYERIATALGKEPLVFGEPHSVYDGVFWGSMARSALSTDGPGDRVPDVFYDLSHLQVSIEGEAKEPTALNGGAVDPTAKYPVSGTFDQVRANWLHYDYGVMEIINPGVESGSLLIIRDSFGSDIERFFTKDYHRVCVVDLRYLDGRLGDILREGNFDDAVYLEAFWTPINEVHQWNLEQALN